MKRTTNRNESGTNVISTARKVTVTMLSEMSGVSRATVSRVLNDNSSVHPAAREKVLKAVRETGYTRVKPRVKMDVNFTMVSIVIDDINPYIEGSYLDTVLRALRDEAEILGITCEYINHDVVNNHDELERQLKEAEAVLMIGMDNPMLLEEFKKFNLPAVIVNGSDPKMEFSSISPDNEMGGFMLANYLIDKGHINSCFINAHIKHALWERSDGFRRAFEMRGLPFNPQKQIIDVCKIAPLVDPSGKLYEDITKRRGGNDFGISRVIGYLIENNYFDDITGIACVCDSAALSVMKGLKDAGFKIPDDFSITGFDDVAIASMTSPALTTMSYDFHNIARLAFSILVRVASDNLNIPLRSNAKVTLIERQSVLNRNPHVI